MEREEYIRVRCADLVAVIEEEMAGLTEEEEGHFQLIEAIRIRQRELKVERDLYASLRDSAPAHMLLTLTGFGGEDMPE